MDDMLESNEGTITETEDRFASPNKLLRIASWAYFLSWVVLVLEALLFIGRLVFSYLEGMRLEVMTAFNIVFYLSALAGGIIWFVVLQAVSEGIYLWLDIEENSRRGNQ